MRIHTDTRRVFYGDVFGLEGGDLNVVTLARRVPIAWHLHQRQTDLIFVAQGRVRVGIDGDFFTLKAGCTLTIPPNRWHGYCGLTTNAILVQFNSPKWDGSDEDRHPIDETMPWDAK